MMKNIRTHGNLILSILVNFMRRKLRHVNAETLRVHLLNKYEVGTIAVNDKDLRIAFSSVEKEDIEELKIE